jgi:hypothetical protein
MEKPWEKVIWPEPKTGDEKITGTGKTVLDYWRWADSDLLSNTARSIFAEFLVAKALGDPGAVRDAWPIHDVTMPAGDDHDEIKIEVKSGGYIQSWKQPALSTIRFGRLRSWGWNPETGKLDIPPDYHADVYVFAVHTCKDLEQLDPTDVAQWDFRVVPKKQIEEYGVKSLTWTTVQRWAPDPVTWSDLASVVRRVYSESVQ